MKKYDIDKILDEFGNSSVVGGNPFPTSQEPEDVEDLVPGEDEVVNLTTNVPGPDAYEVNKRPLQIAEAEADIVSTTTKKVPKPTNDPPPSEPPMQTPDMTMGTASGDSSMADPNMMGMGMGMEPQGPENDVEVGRIYELKKIYSRLVSVQSYLAETTDVNLIKLRNYVANTIDLFRTLISNINLYKDRLDEIIVTFYKVVTNVYQVLSKYYKDKDTGRMVKAID